MRSSNPVIKKLKTASAQGFGFGSTNVATYGGVGVKVLYFLIVTLVAAVVFVAMLPNMLMQNPTLATVLLVGMLAIGVVSSIVASFNVKALPVAGTLYCLAEGSLVGLVSALFEAEIQGIIIMALLATILTVGVVSGLYFTGVVKVGTKFRRVTLCALVTLLVTQLVFFVLSLFVPSVSLVFYNNFGLQLIVTLVYLVVAIMTTFTDFDNIASVVENGLDKQYEWVAAYGLMVTVIWLYIEFLRLAAILLSRKD